MAMRFISMIAPRTTGQERWMRTPWSCPPGVVFKVQVGTKRIKVDVKLDPYNKSNNCKRYNGIITISDYITLKVASLYIYYGER